MRNAMPGAGSKVSGIYTADAGYLVPGRDSGPRDGMDISLSDPEIRTVLARLEDIPEDQRIESGISSAAAMEIISNVSENRQVTVPAELLASLIQTAEQVLWKREWPPVITASPSRNALPAVRRWLIRPASC